MICGSEELRSKGILAGFANGVLPAASARGALRPAGLAFYCPADISFDEEEGCANFLALSAGVLIASVADITLCISPSFPGDSWEGSNRPKLLGKAN